ncbi:unannotated protein [freshwater metagenome]|uniref:Unannotated protein n=1 Tax=freshwater metagenome TaxID=449393 RepID=A0A6J7JKR8_9ZZZZ
MRAEVLLGHRPALAPADAQLRALGAVADRPGEHAGLVRQRRRGAEQRVEPAVVDGDVVVEEDDEVGLARRVEPGIARDVQPVAVLGDDVTGAVARRDILRGGVRAVVDDDELRPGARGLWSGRGECHIEVRGAIPRGDHDRCGRRHRVGSR